MASSLSYKLVIRNHNDISTTCLPWPENRIPIPLASFRTRLCLEIWPIRDVDVEGLHVQGNGRKLEHQMSMTQGFSSELIMF